MAAQGEHTHKQELGAREPAGRCLGEEPRARRTASELVQSTRASFVERQRSRYERHGRQDRLARPRCLRMRRHLTDVRCAISP